MKKKFIVSIIVILSCFTLSSCDWDDIFSRPVDIKFVPYWGDQMLYGNILDSLVFQNHNGETLSVKNLKFIVSNIEIKKTNGDIYSTDNPYVFFSLNPSRRTFGIGGDEILPSGYYDIYFTFGLSNELNMTNGFPEIDDSFMIPESLGGGYHFMQLDGQFINNTNAVQDYQINMNRAVDTTDISNPIITDTSYKVHLGRHYITGGVFYAAVRVKVDISQWFKNPNTIDLHVLNNNLTGNYDAQIQLAENNETVFTFLGIETD